MNRREGGIYRTFPPRTWSDPDFLALSAPPPSARELYLYSWTGEKGCSIPGLLRAGRADLAETLGWSLEAFDRCFAELEANGLARADWQRRVIILPKVLRQARAQSPNVVASWVKALLEYPSCDVLTDGLRLLGEVLADAGESFAEGFRKAFPEAFHKALPEAFGEGSADLLSDPSSNQKQKQKQKQEQKQDQKEEIPTPSALRPRPEDLQVLWNETTSAPIPRCKEMTATRRRQSDARIRDRGLDGMRVVFERLNATGFCRGDNDRGWRASFDWALKPGNITKLLEGVYDNGAHRPGRTGPPPAGKYRHLEHADERAAS